MQNQEGPLMDYPIERCPECRQLNSIKPHSLKFKPVCAICRADLTDPFRIGEDVWLVENDIRVQRLPFEILPPGSWNIDEIIAHYEREFNNLPAHLKGTLQPQRLNKIKKLNPTNLYIGTQEWLGYVIFEFNHTNKIVLECPIDGNATYIIKGNWKRMVSKTKQHLRENYPNNYTKVVHKGDWIERVTNALYCR